MDKNNNPVKVNVKSRISEENAMRAEQYIRDFLNKVYPEIKEDDERYDDLYMSCMVEALKALPDYEGLIPVVEYLKPRLENACGACMIQMYSRK